MSQVIMAGGFDDLQSRDVRRLEEASKLGPLELRVLSDAAIARVTGKPPKFPLAERVYVLESIRFVSSVVVLLDGVDAANLQRIYSGEAGMIVASQVSPSLRQFADARRVPIHVIDDASLDRYPAAPACPVNPTSARRKIIVTGCFDWLHSGHVRFFEEVSELGDLYAVVGSDANIRLLKGAGKPLFGQDQRCYTVSAVRFVKQAMVSTGSGWLDAEPEIERLKPDAYAVNEDGDVPEKRDFCAKHGLEYIVLKRLPRPGLQRRSSTALRGW